MYTNAWIKVGFEEKEISFTPAVAWETVKAQIDDSVSV